MYKDQVPANVGEGYLYRSLLLAAPAFAWPHAPEELVDRLVDDHLQGLLPRS
jgi:hypothetical protein